MIGAHSAHFLKISPEAVRSVLSSGEIFGGQRTIRTLLTKNNVGSMQIFLILKCNASAAVGQHVDMDAQGVGG